MRPRPLQIRELVAAAMEHLEAAAVDGLRRRYVPTRLVATVSGGDFRSLAPFQEAIEVELGRAFEQLGRKDGVGRLADRVELELLDGGGEGVGVLPRFDSSFPEGVDQASWSSVSEKAPKETDDASIRSTAGSLELTFRADVGRGTERRSVRHATLAEDLPGDLRTDRARKPIPVEARAIQAVSDIGSEATWLEAAGSPVQEIELPSGVLVVGRLPGRAHCVPEAAPANLSGRHLALVRGAGGELAVADLGSTNGTWLDGRPLEPGVLEPLSLPARIEIGRRGALRIDVTRRSA